MSEAFQKAVEAWRRCAPVARAALLARLCQEGWGAGEYADSARTLAQIGELLGGNNDLGQPRGV